MSSVMKSYILLTIFSSVSAIIDLQISGSFHTNLSISASGSDRSIISDPERTSFNISVKVVKICVKEYLGGRPDDVFLHSPTPWDLFKRYGWTETYRVLQPVSSRIISVSSSQQMLKQETIDDENKTLWMTESVYNRFSTIWIKAPILTVKRINYLLNVDTLNLSYVSAVGENGEKLKAMKIGVSINVSGSTVVQLFATRVSVKTEVVYEASLWGNVVFNYVRKFRGHHFYAPNLEDIMFNCGINNSLKLRQVVELGYYSEAKVVVTNKTDGLTVLTRNVKIYPVHKEIMLV